MSPSVDTGASERAFTEAAADPAAIVWPPRSPSWLGRGLGRALPAWLVPADERRRRRIYRLCRGANLLEPKWYTSRYGHLDTIGTDPLRHFVERGAARGFLPSPDWLGRSAEDAGALAQSLGKPGRSLWNYVRAQHAPASDVFAVRAPMPLGPLQPAAFASTAAHLHDAGAALALDLLVVDHAMGGGANRYRNQRLDEAMRARANVGLLTYHLPQRRFRLEMPIGRSLVVAVASGLGEVERLLGALAPSSVLLNNLASYPDVLGALRLLRGKFAGRIECPVHDFQAVCPSFNLLDDQRAFCGVPDIDRCRRCIAEVVLPRPTQDAPRDIDGWRAEWAKLLGGSSAVVAFSNSSKELVRRAYPGLTPAQITVRPHRVDYLGNESCVVDPQAPLHLGVVGEISFAKGAAVVAELAAALRHRDRGEQLTVIGTVDKAYADGVRQTGRYRSADLPELLRTHGVNVALVPSIWPETFCYVAEELMHLGLPVAAFDLGAPAERLRHYRLGHVLASRQPEAVLDELSKFWQSLRHAASPSLSAAAASAAAVR